MKNSATAFVEISQSGTMDHSGAQVLGIDAAGMDMVLSILSNMYSNTSLAVVREYSCNALDSHVAAGNPAPIEVRLPTTLVPQLRIQDYGLGLSKDEILSVYAKYGASTKRDSNEQIGAFGIGAKSAFAVGNQFLVTGVKDGQKTVAVFSLNKQGRPTVEVILEVETDEPNGVLVDIGVENIDEIRVAAADMFRSWKRGTVVVDGREPESIWDEARKIIDNVYLTFSPLGARIQVIMGGVSYALPHSLISRLPYPMQEFIRRTNVSKVGYFLNVPIGSVEITPSREELKVTNETTATVSKFLDSVIENLATWVTTEIDKAPNIWEAAKLFRQVTLKINYSGFKTDKLTYRGRSFGEQTMLLPFFNFTTYKKRSYGNVYTSSNANWPVSITDESLNKVLVVTDVPMDKHNTVRRYVKVWIEENKDVHRIVICPDSNFKKDWFSFGKGTVSDIATISYEDFRTQGKILHVAQSGGPVAQRSAVKYQVEGEDDPMTPAEIEALGEDVILVPADSYRYGYGSHRPLVKETVGDLTVVKLDGRKSAETFRKRVTKVKVIDFEPLYTEALQKFVDNMTKEDTEALVARAKFNNLHSTSIAFLREIDKRYKIKNPAVVSFLKETQDLQLLTSRASARLDKIDAVRGLVGLGQNDSLNIEHSDFVLEHLPLVALHTHGYRNSNVMNRNETLAMKHMADYINATVIPV